MLDWMLDAGRSSLGQRLVVCVGVLVAVGVLVSDVRAHDSFFRCVWQPSLAAGGLMGAMLVGVTAWQKGVTKAGAEGGGFGFQVEFDQTTVKALSTVGERHEELKALVGTLDARVSALERPDSTAVDSDEAREQSREPRDDASGRPSGGRTGSE